MSGYNDTFDVGRTCLRAIRNHSLGTEPLKCGIDGEQSNGNGSLMRILPVALYSYYRKLDVNEIIKLTFMEYDNHKSLKEYVSHSRYILQPSEEEIVELGYYNAKILKTKKLKILNQEDLSASGKLIDMYCHLRDDGYLWYDTKLENIGKDEEGNIYLIDYGELIYINDMDDYKKKKEMAAHTARKPNQCAYYDKLVQARDISVNNRNSERCYTKEEIMHDPKYFAQKFSEGNKSLEELLLFCYANDISTFACCAGHENSRGLVPSANIVFNVEPEQYEMFSLCIFSFQNQLPTSSHLILL